jgi:hypothetical protein
LQSLAGRATLHPWSALRVDQPEQLETQKGHAPCIPGWKRLKRRTCVFSGASAHPRLPACYPRIGSIPSLDLAIIATSLPPMAVAPRDLMMKPLLLLLVLALGPGACATQTDVKDTQGERA